jgi:hypothetical protein
MRQIAVPAALGSSALLARLPAADASEWSFTPVYDVAVDYDSDRRLILNGKGSEGGYVTADLSFRRSTENFQITFEPRYTWRRYTDSTLGNGDDRGANLGLTWALERSSLTAFASYVDQTTLISELQETGIVSADTHRRQTVGNLGWNLSQTERRSLVSQLSYNDTSYYGLGASVLSGYKYTAANVGERFMFNERGSFTLTAVGDRLQSNTPGNSSHEYGGQAEIVYAFSELLTADVSLGKTRRELSGDSSSGTTVSAVVSRSLYDGLGKASASYQRSLVPLGFGFLIEQQKYDFVFVRPLNAYVTATVEFIRVQNNEATVLLRLDRPNYNDLALNLDWRLRETWSLGWRVEGIRTQQVGFPDQDFTSWRTSLTLKWAPQPLLRQW